MHGNIPRQAARFNNGQAKPYRFIPKTLPPAQTLLDEPVCFIDTLTVFVRHVPPGIIKQLRAVNGRGRVWLETCRDPINGTIYGWRIVVQQPTIRSIKQLARLPKYYRATLTRLDVAVDFLVPHYATKLVKEWLASHALLKYRRAGPMYDKGGTTCWVNWEGRRKPKRLTNLGVYADRASKITDNLYCCAHLEIRLIGARTGLPN
jgi:hypothetical protein